MTRRPASVLRERLEDPNIVVAMGVHDGMTARIADRAGFEALYHGGYAAAAAHFALPDIGLVGLEAMAESVSRVTGATDVPVIVDADTGFGDVPGVRRTVLEMERAGAAAIQIEDQVFPKRCGHMEGKQVIPAEHMADKVAAAVEARRDPDTLIVARTDALAVTGPQDAIERCNVYAEAGADLAFVDAPRTEEQLADIAREVTIPSIANMSETGKTPQLDAAQLQELGYRAVIFPSTQIWVMARAFEQACRELRAHGTTRGVADAMMPFAEVNELVGLDEWERMPATPAR